MRSKVYIALLMCIMAWGTYSCKKDENPNIVSFKIVKETEKIVVGTTEATISGTYEYPGTINSIKLRIGADTQLFGSDIYTSEVSGKAYTVHVTGLHSGTTYYYRYEVDYGAKDDFLTEIDQFTTQSESPTVKTLEALALDSTTFRIKCEVLSGGGQDVTERGICWNTYGDPTLDDETLQHSSGGIGQYTIRMENLSLGKKYYVRAYARNAAGKLGLSEEVLDFVTEAPQGMPVEIELACYPEQGGTVNGGGTYEVGTQCTVVAEANAGYTFVNWTENGNQVSSDAQYTFAVSTSRSLVANFTKQAYVITAQVDPDDSGTVAGAGGYNYGEDCTLTATANTGYEFEKWTKGNTTVSTDASFTFAVTATATYVAHFKIKSYTISVSANPSNGGTVTGGGTVNYGQSCTVKATPASGYAFTNWTDSGDEVSTEAEYVFTVTSSRTLKANFTELLPDEYTVTVSAEPGNGGTVTGGGTYQQGQTCTVTATPKVGFAFVKWTEGSTQVSDETEYTFTVTGNRVLKAHFEAQAPTEYTVSVSANPSSGGTVTGGGTYEQGQQCTVTATANTGYTFTNWTENGSVISTNANYSFIVNGNRTLVANFSTESYTVSASASPSNGGSVSGAGSYNYGQSCTLRATAASGYVFINWTENGSVASTSSNYTFNVTGNRTLVANFTQRHTVSVSASPSAGGTATGGGTYNHGQSCTVIATAANGYNFNNWTENGSVVSNNANYTFTVNSNRTLVANFSVQAPNTYTINPSPNPSTGGTVTGGGTYTQGQSCTVSATAATGYTFIRWTENGNEVSNSANYTFTVNSNRTLVAQFQLQSYTISASVTPNNSGTVSGAGTYNYGQNCTLTATPSTGYNFVKWTKNGTQVSTDASYTFVVTASAAYVAHFQAQSYTINVSANPNNGGSVTGGGSYNYGQNCTLVATANTGYTFDHWTKDGSTISGGATISFSVTANATYVAYFNTQSYTITTQSNPTNGGTVSGGGNYTYGQNCTLTATANTGYTFDHWTKNGSTISGGATISFSVTASATYVAHFNAQSQVPAGAINGLFTINGNGDQVYFSRGNLQYNKTTHAWSFMEHQYDMVETLQNVGENYANQNIISLFGWGTSGWNSGAVCYQPWSTSTDNSDYYPGGSYTNNLTGAYANADWGVYNSIINGGNQPGQWRTLTGGNNGEWKYIFDTRTASTVNGVANARYAKAKVNNVQGVILFPDSYTHPNGVAQPVGINETGDAGWNGNNYSAADFEMMEQNGCVFLPAAGYRLGTSVYFVGSSGYYWSASAYDSTFAFSVYFGSGGLDPSDRGHRNYGRSVRLVAPAE